MQDAAIRAGEILDPGQDLARRLRNTDSSYRVRLLAQLAKALEASHSKGRWLTTITPWNVVLDDDRLKVIDAGIRFDPGSEDFDADLIHPDIRVYLAPEIDQALSSGGKVPESEAADVYGFAATARSLLQNRVLKTAGGRPVLEDSERYSEELESLFSRCLSTKPGSRPSLTKVRAELEKRSGDAEWRSTATWPAVAATGMAIVLLLAVVLLFFKPEDQSSTAERAFAAAAQITDLDARDAALEEAWVLVKGRRELIPAARRLRAVDDYLRWVRGTGEFELARLLTQVEDEVVENYDDDLARTLRVIVGVLRRWELETEDDVQHGNHLLESPLPEHQAGLAALAEAGRTLDPATSTGTPQARWLAGIEAAGQSDGSLEKPLHYAQGVAPVALESAWLADLVAGRLLTRLGKPGQAIDALERANNAVRTFSTGAALGMALAETGDKTGQARELLSSSLDGRESFVEMQLALARAALSDAHRSGDLKAFAQAGEAFNQVRSAAKGNEELFLSARRGSFEAAFYAAVSLTTKRDTLPKAKLALEQLLKTLKGEKVLRRYVGDVRLALGVVLTRL
ncbi:MAG: serine/threonine-protein kinase, partial [Planctomycetota bacterium]